MSDLIERQAAIDAAIEAADDWDGGYNISRAEIIEKALEQLSSVSTEKTGRWEWNQYDYNPNLGNWHCSECGSIAIECVPKKDPSGVPLYKYCPQCGCRLVGPQESEDNE